MWINSICACVAMAIVCVTCFFAGVGLYVMTHGYLLRER